MIGDQRAFWTQVRGTAPGVHTNGRTPQRERAESGSAPALSDAGDSTLWRARQSLRHVHEFALSRRVSPWATLGVVLGRVVSATPYTVVLPPIIGGNASLNVFVGVVGGSGQGKGGATAVAKDSVDFGLVVIREFTPGSGQGLAHAYAHYDHGQKAVVRDGFSAFFFLEEIEHLVGLQGQQGSTLKAELRRLWMGEPLGHLFVDPTKRVPIEAHTYRAALIAGIQPEKAQILLDDAAGGTPQRWIWTPATYAGHSDVRPAEPEPRPWQLPDQVVTGGGALFEVGVCNLATHAIEQAHLARQRGEGDALDGHLLLCQEKLAVALDLLEFGLFPNRNAYFGITEESWQLADLIMDMSNRTRAGVVEQMKAEAQKKEEATTARLVHRTRAIEADNDERAMAAAERQIVAHVKKHSEGIRACKRRRIDRSIAGKYRRVINLDEVLTRAVARDLLMTPNGTEYLPGSRAGQ